VLGERLARAQFGSVEAALGKSVRLNDREFQVVGVVADGFAGSRSVPSSGCRWRRRRCSRSRTG
jgi:hypothetical protein